MGNQKRKSRKYRQCNDQKKKKAYNYLQNTTQKTKDLARQTLEWLADPVPLVDRVVVLDSGTFTNSCSTSGTCCVNRLWKGYRFLLHQWHGGCVSRLWKGYQFLLHQWHALCYYTLEGSSVPVPLVARVVLVDYGRVTNFCSTSGTRCVIRLWKGYHFLFHQWHALCYQTLEELSVPVPLVAHVVLLDSGRIISSCSTSGTRCVIRLWQCYQFLFHQWHTLCYQTLEGLSVPVPLVARVVLLNSGRVISSCSTSGTCCVSRIWMGYQFLFHQWHTLRYQTLEGLSVPVPLVAHVVLVDSGRVISSCSPQLACVVLLLIIFQFFNFS